MQLITGNKDKNMQYQTIKKEQKFQNQMGYLEQVFAGRKQNEK